MNTKDFLVICLLYTAFFTMFAIFALIIAIVDPAKYIFLLIMMAYVTGLGFFIREAKKDQKTKGAKET